jgi:hypothetical protein
MRKYTFYAIGEIALVVIGILIALSINNWNEERKTKEIEIKLLHEIKDGLNIDLRSLMFDSTWHFRSLQSTAILKNVFENDLPNHDSLAKKFAQIHRMTDFNPNKGAYESMKSLGVMTISNSNLRNEIIQHIDMLYNLLIDNQRNINNYVLEKKDNFLIKHFDKFSPLRNGEMKPNNFEELKTNPAFIYHLNTSQVNHQIMSTVIKWAIQSIRDCVENIENEIIRLEGN